MPRMIDVDLLKPILDGVLTEENEASVIEGIMGASVDYDEEAVNTRINEAVEAAKAEAQKEYGAKLHDMFFGGAKAEETVIEDDTKTDPEIDAGAVEVEDIFEEVK